MNPTLLNTVMLLLANDACTRAVAALRIYESTQAYVVAERHGLTTTVPTLPGWDTWRTASAIWSSG